MAQPASLRVILLLGAAISGDALGSGCGAASAVACDTQQDDPSMPALVQVMRTAKLKTASPAEAELQEEPWPEYLQRDAVAIRLARNSSQCLSTRDPVHIDRCVDDSSSNLGLRDQDCLPSLMGVHCTYWFLTVSTQFLLPLRGPGQIKLAWNASLCLATSLSGNAGSPLRFLPCGGAQGPERGPTYFETSGEQIRLARRRDLCLALPRTEGRQDLQVQPCSADPAEFDSRFSFPTLGAAAVPTGRSSVPKTPGKGFALLVSTFAPSGAVDERAREIYGAIKENLRNELIDEVHVLTESDCSVIEKLLSTDEAGANHKLVCAPALGQPSYADLFRYANTTLAGRSVILSNADIVFDETIGYIDKGQLRKGNAAVLSVMPPPEKGAYLQTFNTECAPEQSDNVDTSAKTPPRCVLPSQPGIGFDGPIGNSWDAYVFASPFGGMLNYTRMEYPMNVMSGENMALYHLMHDLQLNVSNPCAHVNAFHWHCQDSGSHGHAGGNGVVAISAEPHVHNVLPCFDCEIAATPGETSKPDELCKMGTVVGQTALCTGLGTGDDYGYRSCGDEDRRGLAHVTISTCCRPGANGTFESPGDEAIRPDAAAPAVGTCGQRSLRQPTGEGHRTTILWKIVTWTHIPRCRHPDDVDCIFWELGGGPTASTATRDGLAHQRVDVGRPEPAWLDGLRAGGAADLPAAAR